MNGYTMLADSYRKMLAKETSQEQRKVFESEIRVLDFLGTCTDDEICMLFNSSAFNEIMMSYVRKAVKNLDCLDDEQRKAVRNEVSMLLDEKTAKEILEG